MRPVFLPSFPKGRVLPQVQKRSQTVSQSLFIVLFGQVPYSGFSLFSINDLTASSPPPMTAESGHVTVNPDHIDLAVSGMAGPGDRAVRLDYVIAVDPIISERIGVTARPFLHGAVGGEDRRRSETSLRRFVRNESGCKRRGVIGRARIAGGVFPGGARFGVAVGTEEDVLVELEIPNQYRTKKDRRCCKPPA